MLKTCTLLITIAHLFGKNFVHGIPSREILAPPLLLFIFSTGKTPYEAWHGHTPVVGHLRTFGCITYVKELNQLSKLDDRSKPGVCIGYAKGAKAYHILDPVP